MPLSLLLLPSTRYYCQFSPSFEALHHFPGMSVFFTHWFASLSGPQGEHFLENLAAKGVPGKLQPLLARLEQPSVSGANGPPRILEYQLGFGISGFVVGLSRSTMKVSDSWMPMTISGQNLTKQWLLQLAKTDRHH